MESILRTECPNYTLKANQGCFRVGNDGYVVGDGGDAGT
jgi:hypothetical protein